jgi:RNA polymerase sigma factor (sigma-70 family)
MATGPMGGVLQCLRRAALRREGADLPDGTLLGRFIDERDDGAFEALVRRHGPMVLGVCRRLLHDPHDAEDAFQATFLVLVRRAADVRPRELVANWLHGVACRTALKARTLAARRRRRERQVTEMPEPCRVPPESFDDLRHVLDEELSRLSQSFRAPIILCLLEGKSHQEAARQLGWPQGTVSGRLSRGRALLARRLARRGILLSAGSLALVVSERTASACVPPPLLASTVEAAGRLAAGRAATGLVSARVAGLAEGVVRTMLLNRIKVVGLGLAAVLLAGLGTGPLTYRLLADRPNDQPAQARAPERAPAAPASLAGKVTQVGAHGKSITVEVPPPARGEEAKSVVVNLADSTQVTYAGIGPGGARPAEGYFAQVWLADGSKDVAARVEFRGTLSFRRGPDVVGRVAGVATDGKALTFRVPPRTRGEDEKVVDVRLDDRTTLTYSYVARGGTRPTEGYTAQVWLDRVMKDVADRVDFTGTEPRPERGAVEPAPDRAGRVVDAATDGKTFALEVAPRGRGEQPGKEDIRITDKTQITYLTVGPEGDRPAVGHAARVWLAEGSKDTAARVVFQGVPKERHRTLYGKVAGVAEDGRAVTLETRGEGRSDLKLTDRTEVVYQNVGPDGAKPTEGYFAQVTLEDGSPDTAAQVLFVVPGGRR